MEEDVVPVNQDTHEQWNQEPGIVPVPGSKLLKELSKFEQHPSKWTMGTAGPGNPYQYRPFPKMLYRAEEYQGQIRCGAAPVDPYLPWRDHTERLRAEEAAAAFTRKCQRIVKDETEMTRAMEDGWRQSPQEAVEYMTKKLHTDVSDAAAHRAYEDRGMSDLAKREIAAEREAVGGLHVPVVPETPVPSPTETIVADGQCNGKKKNGERCTFKTSGLYCKKHE